jgi:hypothetical protein
LIKLQESYNFGDRLAEFTEQEFTLQTILLAREPV